MAVGVLCMDKRQYLLGVLIVLLMALIDLFTGLNIVFIIPVLVLLLPIIFNWRKDILVFSVYTLIALSIFYSSICVYSIFLLFPLILVVVKMIKDFLISGNVPYTSSGSLGPVSLFLLKVLIVFSLVTLLNYRVGLSISFAAFSLLLLSLYRYIGLLKIDVGKVYYPEKIYLGENALISIDVESSQRVLMELEFMGKTSFHWVHGRGLLTLTLDSESLGRRDFILRIYVYDPDLCARRIIGEYQIIYYVVPSYEKIVEYSKSKVLSRIDIKRIIQPANVKIYVLKSGEEGFLEAPEISELDSLFAEYPSLVRVFLKGLIMRVLTGQLTEGSGIGGSYGFSTGRGVFGEYYGTRYFSPGDRLRDVHWKKSISKKRLVVKEFARGSADRVLSTTCRQGPVIVLDLVVNGVKEFDRLMREFMRLLLFSSTRNPLGVIDVVVVAGDVSVVFSGKTVDVLNLFASELPRLMPRLVYEYKSFSETLSKSIIEEMIKYSNELYLVKIITSVNTEYARNFIKLLIENNILPERNIVILHSSSSALRNGFLAYYLEKNGYKIGVLGVKD